MYAIGVTSFNPNTFTKRSSLRDIHEIGSEFPVETSSVGFVREKKGLNVPSLEINTPKVVSPIIIQ